MNIQMAYLLGMIYGNGEIKRGVDQTTISIDIPHKKLKTDDNNDVKVYVKASILNIKNILDPLLGTIISVTDRNSSTIMSFSKNNEDYTIREIVKYIGGAISTNNFRITNDIFGLTKDEKIYFLKGFADVTGHIRRSNCNHGIKYEHRVYIEIPRNWYLVIDICNLLKELDIPVQTIDWAHPNMRDGKLKKYNEGKKYFWRKEHQIKIYANEFLAISFAVIHKNEALLKFVKEFQDNRNNLKKYTHRYYWNIGRKNKTKPSHPMENDISLPNEIKGKHYDNWQDIAKDLGYKE